MRDTPMYDRSGKPNPHQQTLILGDGREAEPYSPSMTLKTKPKVLSIGMDCRNLGGESVIAVHHNANYLMRHSCRQHD